MVKIYIITNSINDKNYVGQTTDTIEKRFRRHCQKSEKKKNMAITLAIDKYGKENFQIKQIDTADTLEDANKKEVYWAFFYNCFSPNGYNLKAGGRKYLFISDETKAKISKANTGRKVSEETRKRLSESHKGYVVTREARQKLSEHFKGKPTHKNTRMGASIKNSAYYILVNKFGERIEVTNMKKFCKENSLWASNMHRLIKGNILKYKGYTLATIKKDEYLQWVVSKGGYLAEVAQKIIDSGHNDKLMEILTKKFKADIV